MSAVRFCGACGGRLAPELKFCTSCGQPAAQVATPPVAPVAPVAPYPSFGPPSPAAGPGVSETLSSAPWAPSPHLGPTPPRRHGRLLLVGGLAGLLVAVGGGTAAVLLFGGGGGGDLVGAVTSDPEKAWTWEAPEDVYGGVAVGELLIFSNGETGEIWALDDAGEERWTTLLDGGGGVYLSTDDGEIALASGYEGYGISALDTGDGDELWSFDEGAATQVVGDTVLWSNDTEVGALDVATGESRWTESGGGQLVATEDGAFMIDDDEVHRLSLESGEIEWSETLPDGEEDEYPVLAANDEMVAVGGSWGATAYDLQDGAELWSVSGGPNGASVGVFSDTEVYVSETDYSEEETEPSVTVHDSDGERGSLDVGDDGYVWMTQIEMGGDSYAYDGASGRVYDAELDTIGRYEGTVTFVDGGLYAVEEDEISYFELGASSPGWELTAPTADWTGLLAADGLLVLYAGDEVTAYH
jgi:hypothetical protein